MNKVGRIVIGLATMFGVVMFYGWISMGIYPEMEGYNFIRTIWMITFIAIEVFIWKKVVNPKNIEE